MSVAFTREETSELGDRVGTGGADQSDEGKSHCL